MFSLRKGHAVPLSEHFNTDSVVGEGRGVLWEIPSKYIRGCPKAVVVGGGVPKQ